MDAQQRAEDAGARLQRNRGYQVLVGVGIASFGLIHLLWAWLCLQLAFGGGGEDTSTQGAMAALAREPLGAALLVVMAVGLAFMALWQAVEAAVGHSHQSGGKRVQKRLASAGRVLVYGGLAATAVQLVLGGAKADSNQSAKGAGEGLMSQPFGQVLVALVAAVIIALGVGQVVKGVKRTFVEDDLDAGVPEWAKKLGTFGWAAKGVALALVGGLFGWAAFSHDARKAGGLDQALRTLRDQAFGPWLLSGVALGFAAFGIFCFVWARNVRHDKD